MPPKRNLVIETLYDPDHAGKGPPTLDLVLIHGLNGDRIKTWTHEQSKVFWPKELLPKKQPRTRVMSFGYSADIYQNTSTAGIRDNARALLARLSDEREEPDGGRPIVFLAHSLGGLIALRFAQNETEYQFIATATRGILLFGTPHAGADEERWLAIAKGFALLESRRVRGQPSSLVTALTRNSRDIVDICEDFRHLARKYAIVSFYETKSWPGTTTPIVDRMSALMMLDHEDQVPMEANHTEMCRFDGDQDPGFLMTCKRIERAARGVQKPHTGPTIFQQYVLIEPGVCGGLGKMERPREQGLAGP